MAKFIHSILEPNANRAADGEEIIDLPVNPLTAILIHINPLNETSTIANYLGAEGLSTALENIRVSYRGASVIDISGPDLLALHSFARFSAVRQTNPRNTDDERRSFVLPVPLGRKMYDPAECFPETKKGELQLHMTWDIADTGYDTLNRSVETIELPDAKPQFFQRLTTLAQTFAATGQNDQDLPIGQILRGVLCFGTTGYTGAAPAPTLGELRLLVDNIERNFAATDFEVSRAVSALIDNEMSHYIEHFHYSSGDAGDTDVQEWTGAKHEAYTYLDCDPLRNDLYAIDTKGAGRVHLKIEAEAADAARFIPVEKVNVNEFLSL